MAEYIEREAALQFVFNACAECIDTCAEFDGISADCNQCMLAGVKMKLRDVPAADVAPVVRCKDCSFSKDGGYFCTHPMGLKYALPNYFCFHGDRRK